MITFPYGNSDFHAIRTDGHLYLDRTQHIPALEAAGKQLVFLRPRRFGKSLLLSTLANYYDISRTAIYLTPKFNGLCGVTSTELTELLTTITAACQQPNESTATTLETLRVFYNGYRFCSDIAQPKVYNPTLCFYYLRHYQEYCVAPDQILDGNLAMDANKIRYIANLPQGKAVIADILDVSCPMDSETALERRYSDLTLIVRPNMRQYALLDIVMEFKYLSLTDLNLTGEQVRAQSREESRTIPAVQSALQVASEQLRHYPQVLADKYHEPQRLRCLAVVALGFDRLVWEILS
jgi:hypothetical protein